VLTELKAKGYLIHDSGKKTINRIYMTGMQRTQQYAVKVVELPDEAESSDEIELVRKPYSYSVRIGNERDERMATLHIGPFDSALDIVVRQINWAPFSHIIWDWKEDKQMFIYGPK